MRKLITGVAIAASALVPTLLVGPGAVASTAAKSKPKPPVKLPGKVNFDSIATATGGVITIQVEDFDFKPTFVKVPSGTTSLNVTVKNMGSVQHTFTIPSQNIDHVLNPGDSASVTVSYPGKGALVFYCRFHQSRGMQGAFYDKKGAKVIGAAGTTATTKPSSSGGYGY